MVKYQGEDIAFSVKVWTDTSKSNLLNLDKVHDISIYVYTDGCKKVMFSKKLKEGHIPLIRISENEYSGIIDSSVTKLMAPGNMIIEINISEQEQSVTDDHWNLIQKATICVLKKSLIKIES